MVTVFIWIALLIPATVACIYYVVLTLAGQRSRRSSNEPAPAHTFAVLIPAHNEEAALPATLRSVLALDYPPEMMRVYVVADNCTDRTADIAGDAEVICLVRDDPTRLGKGFAVEFGLKAVLADGPDAVLILDADCTIDRNALRELDATFAAGASAAQLHVQTTNADDGPAGYAAAIGAAVDECVAVGLDRLGLSVPLRGTGMSFRLCLLTRVPWITASAVEDAEYAVRLSKAGVRVRLVTRARVSCVAPQRVDELCRQRRRWRSALLLGSLSGLPVRAIQSKPLVLFHLLLTLLGTLAVGEITLIAWAMVLVGLTVAVYQRAVVSVGLTWRRVGLLSASPAVIARLAWVTAAGMFRRPANWAETSARAIRQPGESPPPRPVPRRTPSVRRPARMKQLLQSPFVRSRSDGSRFVSLTFDDGPNPVTTPAVLDLLRQYQVSATFFLIGERVAATPGLAGAIAAAGHTVGNHTLSHPRFGLLDFRHPLRELEQCQDLVPASSAFRPPFGHLTPGVLLAAWRLGLPVVTWSVDSRDWECESEDDAIACACQILEMVQPGDVILMHDNHKWICEILDVLLPGLAARGLLETKAAAPASTQVGPPHRSPSVPSPQAVGLG